MSSAQERRINNDMLYHDNHKYFLASIVESSQDSIVSINFDLVITTWNKAAELVYGYSAAEAIGQSLTMLTLPADLVQLMTNVETIRAGKLVKVFETERVNKDSSRMLLEVVLSPVKNEEGEIVGVSTIARDLTKFREAEKALRERDLMKQLLDAQETERGRIARDLHDEMGQQVTSLRFKLRAAREACEQEAVCADIEEMEIIAQELDNSVDFIAWELTPPALKGVPLPEAMENYLRQWNRHHLVKTHFLTLGLKDFDFSQEVETALYRVMQESLNNTRKHAQAKNVHLLIEKQESTIVMVIEDDGVGFDPEHNAERQTAMGLNGMSERIALVGGKLEIDSTIGKGTAVHVRVPA
jgi:PAS domain S-box-containing protein